MSASPDDARDEEILAAFLARRPSEEEYLRRVESLARAVALAAYDERGASSFKVEEAKTPLELAVAELSRSLRSYHQEGDGCVDVS